MEAAGIEPASRRKQNPKQVALLPANALISQWIIPPLRPVASRLVPFNSPLEGHTGGTCGPTQGSVLRPSTGLPPQASPHVRAAGLPISRHAKDERCAPPSPSAAPASSSVPPSLLHLALGSISSTIRPCTILVWLLPPSESAGVKRTKTKDRSTGPRPTSRDTPQIASLSVDDGELAAAALEPIEKALLKLRERCPAICSAAALASTIKQLDPAEQMCATHMTPLRRAEFIGGRLAAKQALRDAGHAAPVVVADEQGVPIFPAGYVGSIAHKHGRAVAIAAKTAAAQGIGIDLEFDENHDEESLVAEVITDVEQPRLAAICAAEPTILSPATLVLAAKEAVYKAVFQITRTTFDFDDAEVLFATGHRSFHAVRFPGVEHLKVHGEYELVDRWVVAIAFTTR